MKFTNLIMRLITTVILTALLLSCAPNKNHSNKSQTEIYEARLSNIGRNGIVQLLSNGSCEINTDTINDGGFLEYINEPRFNRIDSIEFVLGGLNTAFSYEAARDTNEYYPMVAALPANYSNADFFIVLAAGKMDLDIIRIIINYNGLKRGYIYSSRQPIPATTVMSLSNQVFFDNDGRKMPKGTKPIEAKTYYRIKGRSVIDSTLSFVDLTGEE